MKAVDAVVGWFDEVGTEVEELTEAVLVMVLPSLGAVTRIVMGGAAPGGSELARLQVTPVLVPLQVHLVSCAAGHRALRSFPTRRSSDLAAVLGPALLTVSV